MPVNPFLDDKGSQLAMLLMSLGGGISNAAQNGQPAWAGIGPGVAGYAGAMGQQQMRAREQADQEEVRALRRQQFGLQEREFASKEAERARAEKAATGWSPPGMRPDTTVRMGPGSFEPQQAGQDLVSHLTSRGLSPAQAAAAVGHFQQESSLNPNAVHDGGTGQGLAGWRLDRRDALNNYAKLKGGNVSDPKLQADFFVDELKTRPEWQQFSQAQDPQTAATALMPYFRPAGYTPQNPTGGHGYENRVQYAQAYGRQQPGTMIEQGSGDGMPVRSPPPSPQIVPRPQLPPEDAARLQRAVQSRQITPQQGDAEAHRIITDLHNRAQAQADAAWKQQNDQYRFDRSESTKADQWHTIGPDDAKMYPGLEPGKSYQRNKRTGEIKPIGAPLVTVDQRGQTEFAKAVGKNDAERLKAIQDAEGTMSDFASKISFAVDQFKNTYTGPGGESANAFFKTLGAFGLEEFANKANAADAGMAMISQMKPHMRAAGSGASSDKDMDMFARALPGLLNLPGGNERVASYFQRLADRATQIRQLAEEHSQGGTQPLTGTKFADEVKKLGPLFGEDERKEMMGLTKAKTAEPPPPPAGFKVIQNGGMSPMPNLPPPPTGFKVRP